MSVRRRRGATTSAGQRGTCQPRRCAERDGFETLQWTQNTGHASDAKHSVSEAQTQLSLSLRSHFTLDLSGSRSSELQP